MSDPTPKPPRHSSQLIFGLFLLLLGALLLAGNLGLHVPLDFWLLWPIPLMLLGLLGLLFPSRHLGRSSGLWLFVVGLYGQIGISKWFGLGWSSAWPLFLIASGLNMIFNRRRARDSQVTHEA